MKIIFAILGVALLLSFFTNPETLKHEEAFRSEIKELIDKNTRRDDGSKGILGSIGSIAGNLVVNALSDELISVKDYYFFSIGYMTWNGEQYMVTFGVFSKVFVNPELENKLKERLEDKGLEIEI